MEDELAARRKRRRPSILCQATAKQTGKPCQNPPSPGQRMCRIHGGYTDKGKVAKALVERQIRKQMPPPEQWRHLDPLTAADQYRAESDAWLAVCRRMVNELESFEVTSRLELGDGKYIEKVGSEVRAIVQCYQIALRQCFEMATTAVRLNIQQRYIEQLESHAQLFARVLSVAMGLLAIDVPAERYVEVIPAAIAQVREEAGA